MTAPITFGPFRLDPDGPRLSKGDALVPLQPRPLAVLCHLARRPGAVVGRDELIRTLWAGTFVTKAVLKVAVRAIREALADDVESPRYIETVGREGYRFIGGTAARAAPASVATRPGRAPIVGRARGVAALRSRFAAAAGGVRTVVFVAGEAGIGKTTVIDGFLDDVAHDRAVWIARGQCLEQFGEGEAYLPVLEAVGRLAREDASGDVRAVLARHAPTWASQIPALETADAPQSRPGRTIAPAPARMLREMADALDEIARRRTLVLVLEDLQWSDRSTVDLVGCIAKARQPARLLVIGSFRAADAIVHDHPIRAIAQELEAGGHAHTMALELLGMNDVAAYLETRFGAPASDSMRRLAARIHERTEGNALFMVNMVNDLVAGDLLVWQDGRWRIDGSVESATERVPSGLRDLLGRRLRGVAGATQPALEAASVAGDDFAVASVAAALGADADAIEDLCETLAAQETVIVDAGVAEWPDGMVTGRYRFSHALYRQVLYEGIGEARRTRLHRAIGLREEAAFGARAVERAAQLAMHFERGRDHARALEWHERAASAALDRQAAHEAAAHFAAALDALMHQPGGPERDERALGLLVACATLAVRGYAAPPSERAFARARALCEALPPSQKLYALLRGLISYHHGRNALATAHEFGELLLRHAGHDAGDRALCVQAHYAHGVTLFHEGMLDAARTHLEIALAAYDPETHRTHIATYGGYDPGVGSSLWLAWTLAILGRLDEAEAHDRAGVALARRLGHPLTLAMASFATSVSRQILGDWAECGAAAAEAARLAEEQGFRDLAGMATANRGLALVMQGEIAAGLPLLRDGVAAVHASGGAVVRPAHLALLALADSTEGNWEAAGRRLDEGLVAVERTGERVHEPLIHIGKGHVLAARARFDAAEASFRRALDVAAAQGARLMELSAAVALARLRRDGGGPADAPEVLRKAHGAFVRVRRLVPDLVAARELLAALGGREP